MVVSCQGAGPLPNRQVAMGARSGTPAARQQVPVVAGGAAAVWMAAAPCPVVSSAAAAAAGDDCNPGLDAALAALDVGAAAGEGSDDD